MNEEFINAIALTAKRRSASRSPSNVLICPACNRHREFDAAAMNEHLKNVIKKVFGVKPAKPENN